MKNNSIMNTSANLFVRRQNSSLSDATTGVTLRKRVTNSRNGNVFVGDHMPNGTHLQYHGQQEVTQDGTVWLFVGCRGRFDGWIRKDHTAIVMMVHRSGNATHSDLRRCPTNAHVGFQGRVADGSLVEVIGQTSNEGINWANVCEPITGVYGWIKVAHLLSTAGHAVSNAVGGGGAHHHVVGHAVGGGGAHHHAVGHAVGGGGAHHHVVGGGGVHHHAFGGICPLTEQLHHAAIRASQHQPISQHDMALARQQMQDFRQQHAQAEAMARAQAQARGMQVLGMLGLPFGLQFMGM
jgi:hypothetical protein